METFTSASAFPFETLPSALFSDEVTSRESDEIDKPRLLRETDKKQILFYNSRSQHHLETFTSAFALPHATLPSAPSSDKVTKRGTDDRDKLRL